MAFAEGTTVPAEKSRLEIEALVRKYAGCDAEFSSGRMAGQAAVMFVAKGRRVRFTVPMPSDTEAAKAAKRKGSWRDATDAQKATWIEQETRRRWRCLLLAIKATLEIVESGISSFDEAFLAHVVTESGQTIYERIVSMADNGQRLLPAVESQKVVDITTARAK